MARATSSSLYPMPYTAAVSMVVTPWSRLARIASTDSRSSVPPHIHPPIAQAPKITGLTLTSDVPSCRNCITKVLPPLTRRHCRPGPCRPATALCEEDLSTKEHGGHEGEV